jgi:tetratricopeptide (TPR) repeat protein
MLSILLAFTLGERFYSLQTELEANLKNIMLLNAVMPVTTGLVVGMPDRLPEITRPVAGFQARAMAQLAYATGHTSMVEHWLTQGLVDDERSAGLTQFEICRFYWNISRQDLAMENCRGTVNSAKYWLNQGLIANTQGKPAVALANFYLAAYTDPHMVVAWRHLGHSLLAHGYDNQAVLALERVLALHPQPTPDVYYALSSAYLKLGNTIMARDVLSQGLFRYADQRILYIGMANTYRIEGNFETADSWYARLLQRWPLDANSWAVRGELAVETGRVTDAAVYFLEATNIQPDGFGYWLNLALATDAIGEVEQATRAYRAALALRPEDSAVWLKAGHFLVATNQIDDARLAFEHVLSLQPANDDAAKQLAELNDRSRYP